MSSSTNNRRSKATSGGAVNSSSPPSSSARDSHSTAAARLAGFDPFLPNEAAAEPTTPLQHQQKKQQEGVTTPPFPGSPRVSTPDERNDDGGGGAGGGAHALDSVRLEQLQNELRAIASQLEQDSPRKPTPPPPSQKKKKQKSPRGGGGGTGTGSSGIFAPLFAKKLVGHHHHRKTQSLDANKKLWKEVQEREKAANLLLARPSSVHNRSSSAVPVSYNSRGSSSTTSNPNNNMTCFTPQRKDAAMLQEVWMQQENTTTDGGVAFANLDQTNKNKNKNNNLSPTTVTAKNSPGNTTTTTTTMESSLYIPSLAKPRPTSFLTGQDVVRTSEYDATKWQLDIPVKTDFLVASKVAQFLDTYHSKECLLDLQRLVGYSRFELSQFASGSKFCAVVQDIADCHRPIVESLLDCGDDIVEVRGYYCHTPAQQQQQQQQYQEDLDQRREVLILERQHQFLVVMRGTATEQQQAAGRSFHRQSPETVSLKEGHNVTVFADVFRAVQELEKDLFARLDQLTEATPFCDVVFAGHAFGASMATLAAYLYAYTRSDQRVAALVTGSPKVGLTDFRWSVHASPNLKVMRVEYGGSSSSSRGGGGIGGGIGPSAQHARHVGHTIRLSYKQDSVKAYKFSSGPVESFTARSLLFKRDRDVGDYVQALEALPTWVTDYYKEDGAGVRGKDNEARQMV